VDHQQLMQELIDSMGLQGYDLVLAGDGSGTVADKPCGYCVFAYDRKKNVVRQYTGSLSHGTNNFAELFPYVHAMWHYHAIHYDNREVGRASDAKSVCVVSDSEVTIRQGSGAYYRSCNGSLWEAIKWFENQNYGIVWRHIKRNSTRIHTVADELAGKMRKNHTIT
jgi:ribonuclease HI